MIAVEVRRTAMTVEEPRETRGLLHAFMSDHDYAIGDTVAMPDGVELLVLAVATEPSGDTFCQQVFVQPPD